MLFFGHFSGRTVLMQIFNLTQPDDWHVHFRDGEVLQHTVSATANAFARALVMPNLIPPVSNAQLAKAYRDRIIQASPSKTFQPFMTLYLTDTMTPDIFYAAKNLPYILGAKLYPAGATTNSTQGVHSVKGLFPLLEVMQDLNLVLQIHGEVTHGDIFHREKAFIETYLAPIVKQFPRLRIVLEHISTKVAVDFVIDAPDTVSATITPHHLMFNRNHMLVNGIKPHYYCLPVLKSHDNQRAIQKAAISGNSKFFAGTDSAPHAQKDKENACGCAGIFSAPFAIGMYASLFDELGKLDKLEPFLSHFGADFYQLPRNRSQITLRKQTEKIPHSMQFGKQQIIPILAGETIPWSIHAKH